MQQIFATDRQSMLSEIRDLRAEMSKVKDDKQAENPRVLAELQEAEERYGGREKQWQKKRECARARVSNRMRSCCRFACILPPMSTPDAQNCGPCW